MPLPADIFRIDALGALTHMPPDHPALSSLQFDMDGPDGLTGRKLWERWS